MIDQDELQLLQTYTASCSFLDAMDPEKVDCLAYRTSQFLQLYESQLQVSDLFDLLQLELYLAVVLGRDADAQRLLTKIMDGFGDLPDDVNRPFSSRCIALKTIVMESQDGSQVALDYIESQFQSSWTKLPLVLAKRRIALLKQVGKPYMPELLTLADTYPLDPEIWSQLSAEYYQAGQFQKAVHCLDEILLISPLAYPVYAMIGDILLSQIQSSTHTPTDSTTALLTQANQSYLRSVELCSGYTRGWSGVLITSKRLLSTKENNNKIYTRLADTAKTQLQLIKTTSTPGDAAAVDAVFSSI